MSQAHGQTSIDCTADQAATIGKRIPMKVFVFDLLPYGENLEHLKNGLTELPWPLPRQHFKPEVAVRTYAEHLEAWEELDSSLAGFALRDVEDVCSRGM